MRPGADTVLAGEDMVSEDGADMADMASEIWVTVVASDGADTDSGVGADMAVD